MAEYGYKKSDTSKQNDKKLHEQTAFSNTENTDVRFFRTKDGSAYGFVKDGKIYIDTRTARADTPIHEYPHLWTEAFRRVNPEGWKDIVHLMKDTDLWEQIRRQYPELRTEDELAEEVLAHLSGSRGAELLRAEQERIMASSTDPIDKAHALTAIERVKEALIKFWRGVADWLHIRFTTAEEVADRVLADMLHGVNPAKVARTEGQDLRMEKREDVAAREKESEETSIEDANKRFDEELDDFKNNKHNGLLHLEKPGSILNACGINAANITISPTVLRKHLKKHNLTTDDLKGLAKGIQEPILSYKHGRRSPNVVVVTELDVKGGKLSASFILDSNGNVVEVSNISSVHSKDAKIELERIQKMGEDDFSKSIRWVNKEKVLDWPVAVFL